MFWKSKLKREKEFMKQGDEGIMIVKDALQDVMREISIMKELDHISVIKLHEVIDDQADKLYMMHQTGIVHRDIKPQNIMLDEHGIAKLGDFGCAQRFQNGDDILNNTIGTYQFFSPESDIKTFSGKANDVWALGVTLYALVFNELPFWAETEMQVLEMILQEAVIIPTKRKISEGLRSILIGMLDKDPETRVTLPELKKNQWLNEGFAVSLDSREADFFANYTEDELKHKGVPLQAIVYAKKLAKKWSTSAEHQDDPTKTETGQNNPQNEEFEEQKRQ
ncbi:protein kinase domain containing protein [Stylonychia lemnae]|uniref:Protein kinase domain containing protein n=1 Tax=Stylonychia lemnae TaxID=5949 RepID=A0A078ADI7_STYLE|nr:protein kinase domain containing protein [Stylonychia lemnae]|eukprot:CDW79886.1 protein kinase domain containing protein [Stylonychia lemnae]